MKYIRTKDGIYYVPSLRYQNAERCECEHGLILKQADTIEELCDRFPVIFCNNEEPICYKNYLDAKACNYKVLYGAIWTNKGLIYVAKMNEKGELCLI